MHHNETKGDEQGKYLCGRCNTDQFFLLSEGIEAAVPCPDCGWYGKEKKEDVLPPEVKIDLTQY